MHADMLLGIDDAREKEQQLKDAAPEMYDALDKARAALWMTKEHALLVNKNTAAVIDEAIIEAEKAMARAEGRR